ncbi:MAG: hypothetical protein CL927_16235 [Deltaproteobacteria bacterium]|nr:hypothetical protein [Deltaproteobacteria bacterium]HCH63130.1 hypothetical protein [Deltaproteobacteria bacterium]
MVGRWRGTPHCMASSSRSPNRTLRAHLAASPPHVSLKKALRAMIVALRAAARLPGAVRHPLAGRGDLERVLQTEVDKDPVALEAIKSDLRRVLQEPQNASAHARSAADGLLAQVPRVLAADTDCTVHLENRPPQMSDRLARLLLGSESFTMPADAAARAVHRLHGLEVGGYALSVRVSVPDGWRLPSIPRSARMDRGRWGRQAPWLDHLDEVGRASLTPRILAERMARLAADVGERVVDACCGCGGNTVGFAAAGRTVVAWELDASRAELARRNVRAHDVTKRVTIHTGSVEAALCTDLQPTDLLFIDPPWLPDGNHRVDTFETMFRAFPVLVDTMKVHGPVMLKLPRAFHVDSLPGGARAWTLRYEVGRRTTGDAGVVRMITALRSVVPSSMDNR